MVEQTESPRSIAEVALSGEGEYSDVIRVDKLGDGTYLIYEKQKLFGLGGGMVRVTRLDPKKNRELCCAYTNYATYESENTIIRNLNDKLMKS